MIRDFLEVSECLKTTMTIADEMLKWCNRGKKRKSNIAFGTPSDGIDGSNTMPTDSTTTQQVRKIIASSSSGTVKPITPIGTKVGPLDVLCMENLHTKVVNKQ